MKEIEPLLSTLSAEGSIVAPVLGPGQKEHILVSQDESAFYPNDDAKKAWTEMSKERIPKKDKLKVKW